MSGPERSRTEQIRALIEEMDRVRHQAEQVRNEADRAMKHSFWPDRRRSSRMPDAGASDDNNSAA